MVLIGVLGIVAGIFTFVSPGITAIALLLLIAVWAIATGVFQIAAAIRLRKEIDNEWLLILSGALSVVFGGLMIASPGAGAMAVLWIIGAFAVAYGVLLGALRVPAQEVAGNRAGGRLSRSASAPVSKVKHCRATSSTESGQGGSAVRAAERHDDPGRDADQDSTRRAG